MAIKPAEAIEFQRKRDFGELLGAPFSFVKQEFKPFMKTLLIYAGPYLGIGLLAMMIFSNDLTESAVDYSGSLFPAWGASMGVMFLFFMVGFFMAMLLTHSYVKLYVQQGKDNFTPKDVWQNAKKYIGRYIGAGFIVGIMVLFGFVFIYIPGIILAVFSTFVFFALMYEEVGVSKAISRSFAIVKGNWWFVLGLTMVFGMIMSFVSYAVMIPGMIIGSFISGAGGGTGGVFVVAISMSLYFTIYLIMGSMQQVLVGFTYFSLTGVSEGMNLESKIAAINNETSKNTEPEIVYAPKSKTRVEDYYPELTTPSWSDHIDTVKTEPPVVQHVEAEKTFTEPKPVEPKVEEPKKVEPKTEEPKTEEPKVWKRQKPEEISSDPDSDNRYKKKDDSGNRFKNTDDDIDRFRPKY